MFLLISCVDLSTKRLLKIVGWAIILVTRNKDSIFVIFGVQDSFDVDLEHIWVH